jgi:hypothetical protein
MKRNERESDSCGTWNRRQYTVELFCRFHIYGLRFISRKCNNSAVPQHLKNCTSIFWLGYLDLDSIGNISLDHVQFTSTRREK